MKDFWKGKTVLLTGGAGFLGQHVHALLKPLGCDIVIPRSNVYNLVSQSGAECVFNSYKPDIVIHLAAVVGGIGANRENPGKFFYENAMMGLNVVHYAHKYKAEKLVVLGTVCGYPKYSPVPFMEDNFWSGYPEETNAPYGIAKKMLLTQLQAYRQQYGTNGIYLLPVNLYGPHDNFDPSSSHVIPALIRKFLEATNEVTVWGSGSATREFLYVEDCAEAIVLATEKYNGANPVNIGTGKDISIHDLVGLIAELTDFKGKVKWDESKPDGQPRRCLDTNRARKEFGFKAKTQLIHGLAKTIEWYRNERVGIVS